MIVEALTSLAVASAQPPPGSAYVTFDVDEPEQSWSLRTKEGVQICHLPCARWIQPKSEYTVDRDDQPPGKYRAYVPDTPAFGPNSRVRATVLPRRGSELGPALMLYCGGGPAFAAIVVGGICMGLDCHMSHTTAGILIGVGVAYAAAASAWYFWVRTTTSMEWRPENTARATKFKPSVTLENGVLTAKLGGDGSGFVAGPGFLAGSF